MDGMIFTHALFFLIFGHVAWARAAPFKAQWGHSGHGAGAGASSRGLESAGLELDCMSAGRCVVGVRGCNCRVGRNLALAGSPGPFSRPGHHPRGHLQPTTAFFAAACPGVGSGGLGLKALGREVRKSSVSVCKDCKASGFVRV